LSEHRVMGSNSLLILPKQQNAAAILCHTRHASASK